jgi:hypothetical protein
MADEKTIKFVRLKTPHCLDLIGFVTQTENSVTIEKPMVVDVETIFEEGKQILMLQEFLPQSIIDKTSVEFPMTEVFFVTNVKSTFIEQYESASDYFYVDKDAKSSKKKSKKTVESTDNVISIVEAMITKKDKPVH